MIFFDILYWLVVSVFVSYVTFVMINVGVLSSLSQSYYDLQKIKTNYKYLFQIVLVSMSILLTPVIIEATPDWCKFLGFFTAVMIAFIGLAPDFLIKDKDEGGTGSTLDKGVHMTAAGISAGSSLLWVIALSFTVSLWLLLTIGIFGVGTMLTYLITRKSIKKQGKEDQFIWYAEMACFGWTLTSVGALLYIFPKVL